MQQIRAEGFYDKTRLGQQGDPQGDVQETENRPYEQMVYAQPSTCPRK